MNVQARRLRVAIWAAALISSMLPAFACNIEKVDCNENGTSNDEIGCLHNDNVDRANVLALKLGENVCNVFSDCAAEFDEGGSGGRLDRAECVSEKLDSLEKEALR